MSGGATLRLRNPLASALQSSAVWQWRTRRCALRGALCFLSQLAHETGPGRVGYVPDRRRKPGRAGPTVAHGPDAMSNSRPRREAPESTETRGAQNPRGAPRREAPLKFPRRQIQEIVSSSGSSSSIFGLVF